MRHVDIRVYDKAVKQISDIMGADRVMMFVYLMIKSLLHKSLSCTLLHNLRHAAETDFLHCAINSDMQDLDAGVRRGKSSRGRIVGV